jgi:hypothetical protein
VTVSAPRRAATLAGVELGEPECTALAVRWLAGLKDAGYRVRRGWDSRGPYGDRLPDEQCWLDHLYRLYGPGPGLDKVYVAEPYGLRSADLVELARLAGAGWYVWVCQESLWYPGRTTQVCLQRRSLEGPR